VSYDNGRINSGVLFLKFITHSYRTQYQASV